MFAEILLAAIAEPDAKDLGYLLFLGFSEPLVEGERAGPLEPTGPVAMGIPVGPGEADAPRRFLHEFGTAQFIIGLSFGGHHLRNGQGAALERTNGNHSSV